MLNVMLCVSESYSHMTKHINFLLVFFEIHRGERFEWLFDVSALHRTGFKEFEANLLSERLSVA